MTQQTDNPHRAVLCPNCRSLTSQSDLIRLNNITICSNCEERYLKNLSTEAIESIKEINNWEFAGFWLRAGAYLIDGVVLQIIQLILVAPLLYIFFEDTDQNQLLAINLALSYLIYFAYFTYFHSTEKQASPGKRLLKIRVIKQNGQNLNLLDAYKRALSLVISALPLSYGFAMAGWDPEKRALHDKICSTRVIKIKN